MKRKVLVGVMVCMLAGVLAGCGSKDDDFELGTVTKRTEITTEAETATETEAETEVTTEATTEEVKETYFEKVTDDMYAGLLKGNLTKQQLEFVLGLAKNTGKTSGILVSDIDMYAVYAADSSVTGVEVSTDGYDASFNLTELNNLLSVITDDEIADGTSNGTVNGDTVTFSFPVGGCPDISTSVTQAVYKADAEMYVEFSCHINQAGDDLYNGSCTAVMMPKDDGLYKLTELKDGSITDNFGTLDMNPETSADTASDGGASYGAVLDGIIAGNNEYGFSDDFMSADSHYYTTYDMNGDGIKELIVCGEVPDGRLMKSYFVIFSIKDGSVAKVSEEYTGGGIFLSFSDRTNLYYTSSTDLSSGDTVYNELSYDGNTVSNIEYLRKVIGSSSEFDTSDVLSDAELSDRSLLDE
jgi:hypothetical protein